MIFYKNSDIFIAITVMSQMIMAIMKMSSYLVGWARLRRI